MRHFFAILTFALLVTTATSHADDSHRLNVLFIAADDLRNDLACYGHPLVKTPNIDRLAQRSLVFNKAYCQQAVCNPSRASLLTGHRLDSLRIWDLPTHFRHTTPNVVTLPQHFKNNGYFTQNIGKIFHNFRQEIEGDPDSWSVPAVMHYANHGDDKPQVNQPVEKNPAIDPKCECLDVPDEAYYDGRVASLAVESLKQLKTKSQPFFLAVGFWKPHSPFNAPKKYWDMYERNDVSMPENPNWPTDAPRVAWHNSREILGNKSRVLTPEAVREIRHGYLANISYLDAQVGKVLDELERQQLSESTVIVFWSDHGYHLGEQTLWAKTSNFELDARVPLMICTPKIDTAGKTTNAVTELLDLYPTLMELCEVPKADHVEGVSLVPLLTSPDNSIRECALTQHPRPAYYTDAPETMGYSIRTPRYRYTEWRDWKTGETVARELYDHDTDPIESQNLANEIDQQATIQKHAKLLQKTGPIVSPGWEPVLNPKD
ncbi:MAG: sulfatase [Fuerstiella sp.]